MFSRTFLGWGLLALLGKHVWRDYVVERLAIVIEAVVLAGRFVDSRKVLLSQVARQADANVGELYMIVA